ncbi:CDK5RAP1-like protein [Drosophila guanche]|uniref:CDK5RAP1-like protein n=1 Tax=Drosophila guanche TaxID=7266 RepID=A0A3B0KM75_DROGU|nr:CDK5RAP1-like protein [Drosophila guanche]SPP87679.1 blast:CDK5RAP1-like protein [Drosophila guanche]
MRLRCQAIYRHVRHASASASAVANPHPATAAPETKSEPATARVTFMEKIQRGPGLQDFFTVKPASKLKLNEESELDGVETGVPYLNSIDFHGHGRKVHFEVYGCQMNTNDTEVVWSILQQHGYVRCQELDDADLVMLVTCAVREGAEQKIWNRLRHLRAMKQRRGTKRQSLQITLLGCMAERLKERLLDQEQCVDVIAGPDSYKDLPRLLAVSRHYGNSAINVLLSLDETYADVMPVRLNAESPTAFVSIMRGCDNMCTYCIVPFTRGRERSRPLESIVNEVRALQEQGVKELTLLGQNVNSYRDKGAGQAAEEPSSLVPGFKTVYKPKTGGIPFSELLQSVAEAVPEMRIRFTSPHPKDFSDEVLRVIRDYPNVCKQLHLPAQSGNTEVLARMRRGYTREAYLELVEHIREILPTVGLSSDFICGFCGETESEFEDTVSLINRVQYNVAYLFAYSMREKTTAHRRYVDDVPVAVKTARLQRMVQAFREGATQLHKHFEGQQQLILIEGKSKRSDAHWFGRNDANIKVIVPAMDLPTDDTENAPRRSIDVGDFVVARIDESNSQVLKGTPLQISSIGSFSHRTSESRAYIIN